MNKQNNPIKYICEFCKIQEYSLALRGLVFDESNMRDAFDIICQTLVSRADRFGLKAVDNERRLAQRISNILYGYNLYWAEGTEYKERIVNIHNEMEKEKQRLQMVEPLRTKLSLQKKQEDI